MTFHLFACMVTHLNTSFTQVQPHCQFFTGKNTVEIAELMRHSTDKIIHLLWILRFLERSLKLMKLVSRKRRSRTK